MSRDLVEAAREFLEWRNKACKHEPGAVLGMEFAVSKLRAALQAPATPPEQEALEQLTALIEGLLVRRTTPGHLAECILAAGFTRTAPNRNALAQTICLADDDLRTCAKGCVHPFKPGDGPCPYLPNADAVIAAHFTPDAGRIAELEATNASGNSVIEVRSEAAEAKLAEARRTPDVRLTATREELIGRVAKALWENWRKECSTCKPENRNIDWEMLQRNRESASIDEIINDAYRQASAALSEVDQYIAEARQAGMRAGLERAAEIASKRADDAINDAGIARSEGNIGAEERRLCEQECAEDIAAAICAEIGSGTTPTSKDKPNVS